jgi:hypothetical protein
MSLDDLLAQENPDPDATLAAWQDEEASKWSDEDVKTCPMGHRWPKTLAHPYCPICRMWF